MVSITLNPLPNYDSASAFFLGSAYNRQIIQDNAYFTTLKISMTLAPWHTILEHIAISYCTEFLDVTDETVCMLNNVQTGTIILNYLKMGIFKKQKGTIF